MNGSVYCMKCHKMMVPVSGYAGYPDCFVCMMGCATYYWPNFIRTRKGRAFSRRGRGKDRSGRQGYGAATKIKSLISEEGHLTNKDISERFGRTESWVAQCRSRVGKAKKHNSRLAKGRKMKFAREGH